MSISQTEWVTCYTILGDACSRIDYTLNLIDTPGFGDTRGLVQDEKIVNQIRELFTSEGEKGVDSIDAVCFVLKAPDARLTVTQKYIFDAILSLFGTDIKDNICTLITFADGQTPPVLAALEAFESPLPHELYYTFNNSALFAKTQTVASSLSPFFWEMGMKSCGHFFTALPQFQPKSLTLTAEVLTKRQMLENTIHNLQMEIDVGLTKINQLENEIDIFTKHKQLIQDNKDFIYEVDELKAERIDISGQGRHTTHCLICNYTCHDNCAYSNNNDKAKCCAMDQKTGNCLQCPEKCNWQEHQNLPFIIKWVTHKVRKNYAEKQRIYKEATQKTATLHQVLKGMRNEIEYLQFAIQAQVNEITEYTNRLKEIALRPNPLSTVQYIELMIESEKREKKNGYLARIDTLEKCKKKATIVDSVGIFEDRLKKQMNAISAIEQDNVSIYNKAKKTLKSIFSRKN